MLQVLKKVKAITSADSFEIFLKEILLNEEDVESILNV